MFKIFLYIWVYAASTQIAFGGDQHAANSGKAITGGGDSVVLASASGKHYADFLDKLRNLESGGNYQVVNTLNFLGAYQFGEAALVDLGYVRRDNNLYDNDFGGGFTGKNGIRSISNFLNSPSVQDSAAKEWMKIMWKYIEAEGLAKHAWRKVNNVELTPSGMLAATHLLGTGALKSFIQANGRSNIRDPYGTPLLRYINTLAGYDVPFGPSKPVSVASLDI